MSDAVILSAVRTAVAKGKPDGALARAGVLPTDIAALVVREAVGRAGIDVGAVEMMSQVPMSGYHTRLHPELTESYIGMGFTAERVAERFGVSREDQDRFAYDSQQKAARALAANAFAGQIVPVPVRHVRWDGAAKTET